MLKMRLTFVENEKGREELKIALDKLENEFEIINKSRVYNGSQYSNIYLDLENKIETNTKMSRKQLNNLMKNTDLWD